MLISIKTLLRMEGHKSLIRMLQDRAANEAVSTALRQWSARYRGFAQRRFRTLAAGGGEWPDLAPSTIAGRRKGKRKGGTVQILRDTGLLFNALDPTAILAPGWQETIEPLSILVGYGGPAAHGDGPATIAEIASYHQSGGGNLPQRRIIVKPDAATLSRMGQDMRAALQRLARERIGDGRR